MYYITFRAPAGQVLIADERIRRAKTADLQAIAKQVRTGVNLAQAWSPATRYLSTLVASGMMSFEYQAGKLWTITTYLCARQLQPKEVQDLQTHTVYQWAEGLGYLFAQCPCMKIGLEEVYVYPSPELETVSTWKIGVEQKHCDGRSVQVRAARKALEEAKQAQNDRPKSTSKNRTGRRLSGKRV